MADTVVALDVGGTSMKGAVVTHDGEVRAALRQATPRQAGGAAIVAATGDLLDALRGEAALRGDAVRAAGVAVPGIIDEQRGAVVLASNLGWRDLPLRDLLAERLGLPVALGHDVRTAGRAETTCGAAQGLRDVLFLALGTGISAALIVDGRPLTAGGFAGEVGHLIVDPEGAPCPCGGRGCLETIASAAAVARRYADRSGAPIDAAAVAARLLAGDQVARAVWDQAVDALATVLASLTTVLGPELVVVGGGLAEAGDLLLVPLRSALDDRLTFQRRPRIVRAALGDQAGCLGAALLAWSILDAGREPLAHTPGA